MIDYLEELLQDEDTLGIPYLASGCKLRLQESMDEPEIQIGQAEVTESSAIQKTLKQQEPTWNERSVADDLQEKFQVGSLSYGDVQFEPSAAPTWNHSLYESLHHAARAAQFTGEGQTHERIIAVPTPPQKNLDLADIDRAVERDARRYDSGFSLY